MLVTAKVMPSMGQHDQWSEEACVHGGVSSLDGERKTEAAMPRSSELYH